MKLIFTLFVSVVFALVGRSQTLTVNGTIAASSGTGPGWAPTSFPVDTDPLKNGDPLSATLIVTGFDFSALPPNATISGFQVVITKSAGGTTVSDNLISLRKAGVTVGTNKASASIWANTNTASNYGGISDLWGSTWTPADLNATFGVAIQAIRGTANGTDKALVASVSVTVNYLILAPIILTSFDISKTADNHVSIIWSTATEDNVKFMYIERSADGRNFSPIFSITPVGARNKYTRYAVTDKTPVQGANYYRLKEVDFDGNVSYFDIKAITITKSGPRFQAFYSGADIKVNLSSIKGEYLLSMYDAGGSHIRSQALNIPSNSFQTSLPAPQRAGVYIVTLRGEGINETARIFVGK